MALDFATKEKIKAQLAAKGIFWTDRQIEAHAEKLKAQKDQGVAIEPERVPYPMEDPEPSGGGFWENIGDAVGSTLWSAFDTASFGLGGWAWKSLDEKSYEAAMAELQDTTLGRMGATVGSLAGFMVPMGWAKAGTSLVARTAKTAMQSNAVKAGKAIASPTTRTLQKQAAHKLVKASEKEALKTGAGKTLSLEEANVIARNVSEDVIGFTTKPWKRLIGQFGPAYKFDHGVTYVQNAKNIMKSTMPERLAAEFSKTGIAFKNTKQLGKISDDLVELLATKPYNTIEAMIAGNYSGKFIAPMMTAAGAIGQEAITFGLIGTAMDYVQEMKGDLPHHDRHGNPISWGDRVLNHALMGAAFGGVKFIPGGSQAGIMGILKARSVTNLKAMTKSVRKMNLDEAKAFARLTKKNDPSAIFTINKANVNSRDFLKGRGVTEAQLPGLKKTLIDHLTTQHQTLRKWSNMGWEVSSDMIGSLGRMIAGATIFNYHSLKEGAFSNLPAHETAFHLGLGALMTKGGRPLYHGGKVKTGFHFGERPYFYNSELKDQYQSLKLAEINAEHIGEIVKQFDGNLFSDFLAQNPIRDVENILEVLQNHKVLYNADRGKVETVEGGVNPLSNSEFIDLLTNIIPIARARNLEFNPNITPEVLAKATRAIKSLKSESLSTDTKDVMLDSGFTIRKSIVEGSLSLTKDLQTSLHDNLRKQIGILMEDPNWINDKGQMREIFINTDKIIDAQDKMVLNKLIEVKNNFAYENQLTIQEVSIGGSKGVEAKITPEKITQLRELQEQWEFDSGKKFYGKTGNEPIDMSHADIWSLFRSVDHHSSVERVTDVIRGNEVVGIEQYDNEAVQSLIRETLSHRDNIESNVIADSQKRIVLDTEGWEYNALEYEALDQFVNNLWTIAATNGKRPQDAREVKVPIGKVKTLKEHLVKAGMPDPEVHYLDSRMEAWVNRAIESGLEKAVGKLDPHNATALKRLMINGVVSQVESNTGKGVALEAPLQLSIASLENALPGQSVSRYIELQEVYQRVIANINADSPIVNLREEFGTAPITAQQLGSIVTADKIFNIEKLSSEIIDTRDSMIEIIGGSTEQIKVLEEGLKSNPDNRDQILALMDVKREANKQLISTQIAWANAIGGTSEISRSSAYIDAMRNTRKGGNTLLEHMIDMSKADNLDDIRTKTTAIKDIQEIIANQIAKRPDITSDFSEQTSEQILNRKQLEVEGHMPKEHTNMTPQKFLDIHKKKINEINEDNISYDSASDAMYKLHTADPILFVNKMFELAGKTRGDASNELRNDVMYLSNLFERRYKIKRLVINQDSGKGTYESSEISSGFLTDTFSQVFKGTAGDLILLSPHYFKNNSLHSLYKNKTATGELRSILSGDFFASLKDGAESSLQHLKEGTQISVDKSKTYYEAVDIDAKYIKGKHYIVSVDENMNMVIPESGFNELAKSFVEWHDQMVRDPYTINAQKLHPNSSGINGLLAQLKDYRDRLYELRDTDNIASDFIKGGKKQSRSETMEDAMFTMFNVMYGKKIDGDWLQDAYISQNAAKSSYKYKRLAQNQGYSRNSQARKDMLRIVHDGTTNEYHRDLINHYTDLETANVFVIDDSKVSVTGEVANGLVTDNRSVTEAKLEEMKNTISPKDYEYMKEFLQTSHSINAESVNASTIVRRDFLDYLLLLNGQEQFIGFDSKGNGKSAGQKPVGLSSFEDANGNIHVFYNKTHYFYNSKHDPFFANNPSIHQIAFKSGVKKAKIIDKNDSQLINQFKAYDKNIPVAGTQSLTAFINNIKLIDNVSLEKSVMPARFNDMLSGVSYGPTAHAKILKQFDNWTSIETQADIYNWARAEVAEHFAELRIELLNPENTSRASREARSFINTEGNSDGFISTNEPNASFASIWINSGGVPFTAPVKNLYDALIKKKYIDNPGVFDGYTDAGGTPIVRGNFENDLLIPIYNRNQEQVKLGETKISASYLDRNIHFRGEFGEGIVAKAGEKLARPKYKNAGTLTVAIPMEGRDVLVNVKTGALRDPSNPKAKLITESRYKDVAHIIADLQSKIGTDKEGALRKWRDVFHELQDAKYKDSRLVVTVVPSPRTGVHDMIIAKVKDVIDPRDGGVIELNTYDATMRAQRDMDTDKLTFYMDTPFSAVEESYRVNGNIKEALPGETLSSIKSDLDLFDNASFRKHTGNIKLADTKRGPIVKMHRKLTYAQRLFEVIESIDLGDQGKIVFSKSRDAQQRLVSDTQNVLDIYKNIMSHLVEPDWARHTLFGNSQSRSKNVSIDGDRPFFELHSKDGNPVAITENAHQFIVEKILNDFGTLLNLESKVWEAGEAKTPRYTDMVSAYKDFRSEYNKDSVNWNFYHYIKKRTSEAEADALFFKDSDSKRAGNIEPIMSALASEIQSNPTPFLKSLNTVAGKDFLKVAETYSPKGNYFNKGIDKIIGQKRGEALEVFRIQGDKLDPSQADLKDGFINDMWTTFTAERNREQQLIQANTIREQIKRSEWMLSEAEKRPDSDKVQLEIQRENIELKNKMLQALMDKIGLESKDFNQELIYFKTKDGASNTIHPDKRNDIVIRRKKSGAFVKRIRPDGEAYELRKDEVAVKNPVVLTAVVNSELLDGAAWAQSTLGYYSHIAEADLVPFRTIVNRTKRDIKKSMMDIMDQKGYKDWTQHQGMVRDAIDRGLRDIVSMAKKSERVLTSEEVKTFLTGMPKGTETYGVDFIMSLLQPDHTGNPNERYFSPKTHNFYPAVRSVKPSVVNAAISAMDMYGLNVNHKGFISDLAKTHRGFYDAMVAGRGYQEGMELLYATNFEGALLSTTISKAMNNPFMPRSEFKSMKEIFDPLPALPSDFAESIRQIFVEGSIVDPGTMFNLKRRIIEHPELGEEVYNRIFKEARGHIVYDGINSRQFGVHAGEGQLLSEILQTRKSLVNRELSTSLPGGGKDAKLSDMIKNVVGRENEITVKGGCE